MAAAVGETPAERRDGDHRDRQHREREAGIGGRPARPRGEHDRHGEQRAVHREVAETDGRGGGAEDANAQRLRPVPARSGSIGWSVGAAGGCDAGQRAQRQRDRTDHDGHVHEEDRAPAERADEHAAERRADRGGDADGRAEQAEAGGAAALGQRVAQERHRVGEDERAGDRLAEASGDEQLQ